MYFFFEADKSAICLLSVMHIAMAMYESHIRRASQNVFFADSAWLLMPCSGDGSTVAEPLPLQNQPLDIVAVASNGEKPL